MLIPRRWPHVMPGELERMLKSPPQPAEAVDQFELVLAAYTGAKHAVCLNSGRQGMTLILRYLGVRAGDEVVVPAYTLGALIPLVEGLGARAVPADIDPRTMNVTVDSVRARMTPATRAVIVLHAFGAPAPVDDIVAMAENHGVKVVEDCAHSLGATLGGLQTGTFGDAGFFSFEITKPLNTYGGGAVVTNDDALADYLRRETASLPHDLDGLTAKVKALKTERLLMGSGLAWPLLYLLADPRTRGPLSALYRNRQRVPSGAAAYTPAQAQLGLEKTISLEERIAARNRLAERYSALLHPSIKPQRVAEDARSTWYFYVVRLPIEAGAARLALLRRGIDTAIGDEIADDVATPRGFADCPHAAALPRHAMALPMYEELSDRAVARVANALNRLVKRRG